MTPARELRRIIVTSKCISDNCESGVVHRISDNCESGVVRGAPVLCETSTPQFEHPINAAYG